MRSLLLLIASFFLALTTTAQAQTSFMDLWCEYGGKGCVEQPQKAKPAPVAQPVPKPKPVQAKPKPQPKPLKQVSTPLITRNASLAQSKGVTFGRYYALVIGNNKYPNLDNLKTAIHDAKQVGQLLKKSYGFSVTQLINASRDQIIAALDEYRKILREEDNLLIYYAGHGWLDKESERGYWLPVDAAKDTRARWVSNADITDTLKALKARHVMVVADSCYAGTLTRSAEAGLEGTRGLKLVERPSGYLETLVGRKSRTVLASGALEPVSDQGGGKHSVFAYAFLKSLQENKAMMDGTQLFGNVRKQVLLNARQTPQYSNIRFAGHDIGGDFVFLRRDK
ncbi:caspase family protein [Terasakiella sp. SH-1]|uniref:caspase family protein n=1 Tax=Terasakiella sp. SH-1 TaxID=2560057 RepID=UPI00107476DD|nr:caspase family protein [Terasakiella sp. SH-1]